MSTKNLARTVIEGGRYRANRWFRRYSHKEERAAERQVGERDTPLYWFVPTPAGAFRQAAPLDEAEAARWRSLPGWYRERWDAFAAPAPERSV